MGLEPQVNRLLSIGSLSNMNKFYAQIENGICVGVSSLAGEVNAPDLVSIAEYDTSLVGKHYANGVFSEPPRVLDDEKAAQMKAIYAEARQRIEAISAQYPEDERRYWPQLEAEAALVAAGGNEADAPLLAAEATAQGRDFSEYAAYIAAKADAFRAHLNAVKAWRTTNATAVQAIDTLEAMDALSVSAFG